MTTAEKNLVPAPNAPVEDENLPVGEIVLVDDNKDEDGENEVLCCGGGQVGSEPAK